MKKIYLLFASLVCFFILANAQPPIPVLTDWNINPEVGQSFGYNEFYGFGFTPGSAGSQVTWNFSTVGNIGHFVENYVSTGSTGWDTAYPFSNIALQRSTNSYSFFNYGAAGQTNYGDADNGAYNNYWDGEDYLHLPFTFTNSYTDSFHSFNNGIYRYGKVTITADGYGTLMFPSATFSNVLRVHFQERFIDSGLVVINDQSTDLFKWYVPWIHSPVFVHGYVTNGASPTYYAYYLDAASAVLGHEEELNNEMQLNVFPNPTVSSVNISYYLKTEQNTALFLSNVQGVIIKEYNFKNELGAIHHEIDLSDHKKGLYFLQLNKGIKKKLVID